MKKKHGFIHKVLWYIAIAAEGLGFFFLVLVLYLFPLSFASTLGGWLGRTLGPRVPSNKRALRNLRLVFPNKTQEELLKITRGMWDNLGRTFFEYLPLKRLKVYAPESPVEVVGAHIINNLKKEERPAILFLGHLANWELATLVGLQRGLKIAQVYRRVNNPLIAWAIRIIHGRLTYELVEKGAEGAKQAIKVLKKGDCLSMLMDQKMNEGLSIPFLGIPAMTAPAIARLAIKFDCPIIPIRVERIAPVRFRVTYFPPLAVDYKKKEAEAVQEILTLINQYLSNWILEQPEQWFWLHRRWPSEAYKALTERL